jgi:2-phosphoglycerate kinase
MVMGKVSYVNDRERRKKRFYSRSFYTVKQFFYKSINKYLYSTYRAILRMKLLAFA